MLRLSACEVIHNMTELQKQYVNEKQNSKMQAFQRRCYEVLTRQF